MCEDARVHGAVGGASRTASYSGFIDVVLRDAAAATAVNRQRLRRDAGITT